MAKSAGLKNFNVYKYLKEQAAHSLNLPYFLADQAAHKKSDRNFPIRTSTYAIGINYSGEGLFRIGSNEYHVQPGSLINIGPGIVCQWMGDYNTEHDTIYFTEDLFKNTLKNSFLSALPFFSHGGIHVINLQQENVDKIKALFDVLRKFKDDADSMTGLVHALLTQAIHCHNLRSVTNKSGGSVKEKIARDFKSMLSKHFLERKEVGFYAEKLNLSPKYLSEVLVSETGSTTKKLIEEHVFFEAKSLLRQTNMSVQEICYSLGYEDATYFTKAFKRLENMTPMAYRKL